MTKATKEHPILFRPELVRKILAGKKTQTRRPMKPQPEIEAKSWGDCFVWRPSHAKLSGNPAFDEALGATPSCVWNPAKNVMETGAAGIVQFCPFGQVGEVLWVRERWSVWNDSKDISHEIILFAADESAWWNPRDFAEYFTQPYSAGRWMEAEFNPIEHGLPIKWRPSIHMPRWACRLRLEITDVRVERVQGISEADAVAEGMERIELTAGIIPGVEPPFNRVHPMTSTYAEAFHVAWNKAYPGSWDKNEWVWVIAFKVLT